MDRNNPSRNSRDQNGVSSTVNDTDNAPSPVVKEATTDMDEESEEDVIAWSKWSEFNKSWSEIERDHSWRVNQQMKRFAQNGMFVDMMVGCGNNVIAAHRFVMVNQCKYFLNNMTPLFQRETRFPELDPMFLHALLLYVYSKSNDAWKNLPSDLLLNHLEAVLNLKMPDAVTGICCDLASRKSFTVIRLVWLWGSMYHSAEAFKVVAACILPNLKHMLRHRVFADVTWNQLEAFITMPQIQQVQPIDKLILAVLQWFREQPSLNLKHMELVAAYLDLRKMTMDCYRKLVVLEPLMFHLVANWKRLRSTSCQTCLLNSSRKQQGQMELAVASGAAPSSCDKSVNGVDMLPTSQHTSASSSSQSLLRTCRGSKSLTSRVELVRNLKKIPATSRESYLPEAGPSRSKSNCVDQSTSLHTNATECHSRSSLRKSKRKVGTFQTDVKTCALCDLRHTNASEMHVDMHAAASNNDGDKNKPHGRIKWPHGCPTHPVSICSSQSDMRDEYCLLSPRSKIEPNKVRHLKHTFQADNDEENILSEKRPSARAASSTKWHQREKERNCLKHKLKSSNYKESECYQPESMERRRIFTKHCQRELQDIHDHSHSSNRAHAYQYRDTELSRQFSLAKTAASILTDSQRFSGCNCYSCLMKRARCLEQSVIPMPRFFHCEEKESLYEPTMQNSYLNLSSRQHFIENSVAFQKKSNKEAHESNTAKFLKIFQRNAPTRQVIEGNRVKKIVSPTCIFIGLSRQNLMSVQLYIIRTEEWTNLIDMDIPYRNNFAAIHHNGHLFVCGGEDPCGNKLKTCFSFDFLTCKVSERADLRTARSHANMIAFDHSIFIIGGKNSRDTSLSTVEVLDHRNVTNMWKVSKSMRSSHVRAGVAPTTFGDFYVVGGYSVFCECFVAEEGRWREFSMLPLRFSNHGMFSTFHDNKIYTFVDYLPSEVAILDPVVNEIYVTPTYGKRPLVIEHVVDLGEGKNIWAIDGEKRVFAYNTKTYTWERKFILNSDLRGFLSVISVDESEIPFTESNNFCC